MIISDPGVFELTEPTTFSVKGDDVTVRSDAFSIVIKYEYSPDKVIHLEGNRITLENIILDVDFRNYNREKGQELAAILAENCTDLRLDHCKIILRIPYVVPDDLHDKEGPRLPQVYSYIGFKVVNSHGVHVNLCPVEVIQYLPDGTEVRHVIGAENTGQLYINGYPIVPCSSKIYRPLNL